MIRFNFEDITKRHYPSIPYVDDNDRPTGQKTPDEWWVMYPYQCAVIARCDTEKEADEVIEALKKLADRFQ